MNFGKRLINVVAINVALALFCLVVMAQTNSTSTPEQTGGGEKRSETPQPRGPEPKGLVPRFGIVWEGKLTRSGKPKDAEAWKWLREQGTNSIVNFRASNDIDYSSYGFGKILWIPMDNGRLPTEEEAKSYLAWIQDPVNQPVNIQCAEGKDRTGMMAALARYAVEGWPMEEAIKEASIYRRGKPLAEERINWLRDWARKHSPGSHRAPSSDKAAK
jgi:hypothetical protein